MLQKKTSYSSEKHDRPASVLVSKLNLSSEEMTFAFSCSCHDFHQLWSGEQLRELSAPFTTSNLVSFVFRKSRKQCHLQWPLYFCLCPCFFVLLWTSVSNVKIEMCSLDSVQRQFHFSQNGVTHVAVIWSRSMIRCRRHFIT